MTSWRDLTGTKWSGQGELWLDDLGNQAELCACEIDLEDRALTYRWSYQGAPHTGVLALRDGGADFTDSWHSPKAMACADVPGSWGLVEVMGTYAAGDGPPWGWRIALSLRPSGELLLQMTNISSWGEDGRAVRMICKRL
ncbi:MAG TPA: hypothetical protein PKU97_08015 [Kofleriaceae bacterium]|nr:hypothetical protein [Kofleriaceae bacterium]